MYIFWYKIYKTAPHTRVNSQNELIKEEEEEEEEEEERK
jgi:hypothetical protein